MCREKGGIWKETLHGQRGCRCADGKYLVNLYFEVCSAGRKSKKSKSLRGVNGIKSQWAEKGSAWSMSRNSRFLPSASEVAKEFVEDVNRGDIDSAMGLVNDYDIHPSRKLDGINELIRRFTEINYRDWDMVKFRKYGAAAEPGEKFTGCIYFEEFTTTLVNKKEDDRGIAKMHIYCAQLSAKNEGLFRRNQAEKVCSTYEPKNKQLKCKLGYIEVF